MSLNDEMVMDSSRALQIETSAIVYAAFVGVLGWDVATSLVCDIRLLCSKTWLRSPIRVLSRLAYILSRYCALISLMLSLKYWFYPNEKDSYCKRMPYVIVALMTFSYINTLVVLMLRTLALYPTSRKRDWAIFYLVLTVFASNAVCAIWLPFEVRGSRVPNEPTRCQYTQTSDDKVLRGFLITGVIYDIMVLGLTSFKLYSSGELMIHVQPLISRELIYHGAEAYQFYTRHTFVGRTFLQRDTTMQESPLRKMAAQLIGSGLYDFAAITIVSVGALAKYLAINVSSYQATTLNCIGAVSAALAGGVFRDTARAAKTIREVYRQEEVINRLVASSSSFSQKRCKSPIEEQRGRFKKSLTHQDSSSSSSSHFSEIKPSAFDGIALDFSCSVKCQNDGSPSIKVEEMRQSTDQDQDSRRRSIASQQTLAVKEAPSSCPREVAAPVAGPSFDRYLPSESQRIVDTRRHKRDGLMPLQVSLRAFDDGADVVSNSSQMETLATVSVIGGSTQHQDYAFSSFQDVEQGSNYSSDTIAAPSISLLPPPRAASRARAVIKR